MGDLDLISGTKAVEEQHWDLPATNAPLKLRGMDPAGRATATLGQQSNEDPEPGELRPGPNSTVKPDHMVSPKFTVAKSGMLLSSWHHVQLQKARDTFRKVRECVCVCVCVCNLPLARVPREANSYY